MSISTSCFLHIEYNRHNQIVQNSYGISQSFVSFFETFDESIIETQNRSHCSYSTTCCFIKCIYFDVSFVDLCVPHRCSVHPIRKMYLYSTTSVGEALLNAAESAALECSVTSKRLALMRLNHRVRNHTNGGVNKQHIASLENDLEAGDASL